MASVTRRIRRNMATRAAWGVRGAYATRHINANERDEKIAALVPSPRPLRFARALTALFAALTALFAALLGGGHGR